MKESIQRLQKCQRLTLDKPKLAKIDPRYQLELYTTDFRTPELGKWIEPSFGDIKTYHPVFICQKIIKNGLLYICNEKYEYREVLHKYFELLLDYSFKDNNQLILFPYTFDFQFGKDLMKAPWYSGMAQGQVLSALAVLYMIEKKDLYVEVANKVLPTLLYVKNYSDPWFSFIDEDGYLWIEEYPHDKPSHVLNGFIYALLGVYDALVNMPLSNENQEIAYLLLNCGLKTILDKLPLFMNQSNMSFYSVKYPYFSWYYHKIHYTQAWILFLITSEERFLEYFNVLREGRQLTIELKSFLGSLKQKVKNTVKKII